MSRPIWNVAASGTTQDLVTVMSPTVYLLSSIPAGMTVWLPQVRLQEIPSGSRYKNLLNDSENCCLFLDIFSSMILNDLALTFPSRLKMDAKCANQQLNWIRVGNYFEIPQANWVHAYLSFEPGTWIWTNRFWCLSAYCEKIYGNFSLNSARIHALGWLLLFFSGFF